IDGHFDLVFRTRSGQSDFDVDGELHGGEFLAGNTYVALPDTLVALEIEGESSGVGWRIPHFEWRDPSALTASGSASIGEGATLQALEVSLHSEDITPLRDRYLSGWLGLAGLGEMEMRGAVDATLRIEA